MKVEEINNGITLVCNTSKEIQNCYESKQSLVDSINAAKKEDIEKCWEFYKDREGVIVDVRKELFKVLREGKKITVNYLDELVAKFKEGKENQFRVYKNFYTIFYPAITFYGHNEQRLFVKNFAEKLILDLGLDNNVKTTSFDFQGARQQGSDRFWLAIYNQEQENQSTGLQFFIDFHHGSMSYGIYQHSTKSYLKDRVLITPETFNYDEMINYFKSDVDLLLNDLPKYDNLTNISLENSNLYKISHGTFKAKNKSHIISSLKENNWIILHETTGKDQSRYFKEDLHVGDYVYITLGSKELIGIGKIISEEWDYVPNEIIDADGWMYREIEFIKAPKRKSPKDLNDTRNIFPSGNSTLTEITPDLLEEANEKLFKPYFNVEITNSKVATVTKTANEGDSDKKFSLNQILYGPPGTGKTYRLQNEFFEKFTVKESSLSREQYLESIVADLSWWQVISIAVLDLGESKVNDIHNHEFVKFKEKLSSSKTVRPTIWGQLQSHTVRECPNVNVVSRSEPLFFNKSADSKWTIDTVLLEEYYPEAIELLAISKSYKPSDDITIKNYDFVTFHQSFSYEDFVEGIKPRLEDGEADISFEIKDGIFKKLCIKAEADPYNNYAVFIDEINRGNVSAIFGELITLIEDDKRIGAANELRIKLPYSKRELGVPSNLYIIGTMNTADRSVEAIDTALRRRFSFSEIMPNSKLLKEKHFNGFNLGEVLSTINERIEVLLDRDHTIGHSYFLKINNGDKNGLKSVFKNNIFPLLQEYFYHDYEKIALILGEGFVRIKENKTTKFAAFKNIDQPEIMTQFELIDEVEDIEGAVKLLLNN
jgi:5-methylcytosine-specific restriction endonuclease McrBC GTP-binding regulatory subunit McrB